MTKQRILEILSELLEMTRLNKHVPEMNEYQQAIEASIDIIQKTDLTDY